MAHTDGFFCLGILILASLTARSQQGSYTIVYSNVIIPVQCCVDAHNIICVAGVSLKLRGVTIPNNSLVDLGDLLYRTPSDPHPNNANGLQTLMCVTDLVDCCETQGHGNWYYPSGTGVPFDTGSDTSRSFLANRGQYEVRMRDGRQFNGSVRIWRRWSDPFGRGRFRCELPSTADPSVNQTLYVNIGE